MIRLLTSHSLGSLITGKFQVQVPLRLWLPGSRHPNIMIAAADGMQLKLGHHDGRSGILVGQWARLSTRDSDVIAAGPCGLSLDYYSANLAHCHAHYDIDVLAKQQNFSVSVFAQRRGFIYPHRMFLE